MHNNFENTALNFKDSSIHSNGKSLNIISALIPWNSNCVFADFACGTGNLGSIFQPLVAQVIFVDSSKKMLDLAKEKTRGCGNVRFINSDCHYINQLTESIDIIGTRFAFHHFERPLIILKEGIRLLRPGGILCIIDLVGTENSKLNLINHQIELLHDETHIKSYTSRELKQFADLSGFEFEKSEDFIESEEGIPIADWCKLTDRGKNLSFIKEHLDKLTAEQLFDIGYSKTADSYVNHVKIQITILKKAECQ